MQQRKTHDKGALAAQPRADGRNGASPAPYVCADAITTCGAQDMRAHCRTQQEQSFVSILERESLRLERLPTLRELKTAMTGTGLEGLSKDRLRQIFINLNMRLPAEAERISLTVDRSFFRDRRVVTAAYGAFRRAHQEPPTLREIKELARQMGHAVTDTSLQNILRHLRTSESPVDHGFEVSRRRGNLTASDIRSAYSKAAEYLRDCGIEKAPSVALVRHYLRVQGQRITHGALRYRLANSMSLRDLSVSANFDPADQILARTHKRLCQELQRPPTVKELAADFNCLSLSKASADAVWTRVQRLNASRAASRRLGFSATFGSGIYDHDLKRAANVATSQLGRAPTLKELQGVVLELVADSNISLDALHRRLRALKVPLTSEHTLTKESQKAVVGKIQELRAILGRSPFGVEVREALTKAGLALTQEQFNRVLASAKRHRGDDFRRSARLGFPSHLAGKLRQAHEEYRNERHTYPSVEELAKILHWTVAGVAGALPLAQQRAAKHGFNPVVLSNAPEAQAMGALETIARRVVAPILDSEAIKCILPSETIRAVYSAAGDWSLPAIPYDSSTAGLSLDEKIVRCEQWWVLVVCLNVPRIEINEDVEFEARVEEAHLAKRLGQDDLTRNPFDGFIQVLRVAREAGRLGAQHYEAVIQNVGKLDSVTSVYSALRTEVQKLAMQSGFPQLRPKEWSVLRKER